MVSEETYELCLPILSNDELGDEEKVEKLEEFLQQNTSLTGSNLEDTILDVLHRHRHQTKPGAPSPPLRHTVIRRSSPAPWQIARSSTPLSSPSNTGTSPAAGSGFPIPRGGFPRGPASLSASPFTSPRPSPRLAMAQPIPHSPNLNAYEFADQSSGPDFYGDLNSDTVDWLVNEDARSTASSTGLNGYPPEWVPPSDMDPYDILRTVLGDRRTNEEIEAALEANAYDLAATMAALTEKDAHNQTTTTNAEGKVLVGKSMTMDHSSHVNVAGQGKSPIVCKYWLSTGQCLRADCRFSHDLMNHICKYWLAGNCLAGNSCPFSHDPSTVMGNLSLNNDNNGVAVSAVSMSPQQTYGYQDSYDAFPALPNTTPDHWPTFYPRKRPTQFSSSASSSPRLKNRGSTLNPSSRPHSRPTSRHQQRDTPSLPVDDPEAFPTLASVTTKNAGKKHGKRGGSSQKENNAPSSLADVVRMSPSPAPGQQRKGATKSSRPSTSSRENSAAAQAIPAPKHIPWLETGPRANQQYLKYRQDAITHGNLRNKFLQSAAQAWNRNDARAAKTLSLRGQAENEAMRRCHREAARALYEERNKHLKELNDDDEIYVDLHGLHPNEAVEYLENVLMENEKLGRRVIYAITGSGHHSKNGKDKIGKAAKNWLNEWRYAFREFGIPGERGGASYGGILGIDPTSYDHSLLKGNGDKESKAVDSSGPTMTMGKIQLLKREDVEKAQTGKPE
ncbi:hypothetical protein VTO42DRAFT_448 [Malbranchea cinnamomea]